MDPGVGICPSLIQSLAISVIEKKTKKLSGCVNFLGTTSKALLKRLHSLQSLLWAQKRENCH